MLQSAPNVSPPPIEPVPWEPFPQIDLRQLLRMTDDTGMFQHAIFGMPDPNHGYCIDDNARAVIASLLYSHLRGHDERSVPLHRYLTFLAYAFNEETGTFRNFMGYDRRWLEDEGSQDSQGRTLWALGLAIRMAPEDNIRELATQLMHRGLPAVERFGYLRSWAFALLGLDEYLKQYPDDGYALKWRAELAERLLKRYTDHATEDWPWWEDVVTYDNAKLSHALLVSGANMGRPEMVEAALASLRWLLEVQIAGEGPDAHLSIIGNAGWLRRDGHRAQFDQQPLEAYAMVHACLAAAEVTGDPAWADHAWRCFEWFRGKNDLGVPLYNEQTGGCQDGLLPDGANKNQGAESSLAYLLSVLELHRYRDSRAGRVTVKGPQTIGYAIAGVSKFAEFCLETYQEIGGLKAVAAWNRTTSKAEALAERTGIKAYADYKELLADPRVQVVHVGTTPATHADLTIAALSAGKHVLCEKPLATDPIDAQRMITTAATRDLVLAPDFMMRYGPLAKPVKAIIDERLLGGFVRGYFTNRAGDAGLPPDHWFWDESQSGGIFVEHGVHAFDLVRYWAGQGSAIGAWRLRRPGNPAIIDQVGCDARYGTGAVVSFYHGFLQPSALDQQDFRLVFERGEIRLVGWIASELSLHALVTDAQLERLQSLLPDAEVTTLHRFEGGARKVTHRHTDEELDQEVRIRWTDPDEKQTIYKRSLRLLMEDVLQRVRDRSHRMTVNLQDALGTLNLAVEATRMAKTTTP